jgi:uncharacterized membrane protein YfcA
MSYENKVWVFATFMVIVLSVVTGFLGYGIRYIVGDHVTAKLFVWLVAILGFKFWYTSAVEAADDMVNRKK